MILTPFQKGARGFVKVPGSKSLTNRALLLAALADGKSFLRGGLLSDDSKVMISALSDWGIDIFLKNDIWEIAGRDGKFAAGNHENFLGNAGTAMRFLTAAAGFCDGEIRLFGKSRMHARPIGDLVSALSAIGVEIFFEEKSGFPPVKIFGKKKIRGGKCNISGKISSQFLSAILLVAAKTEKGVEIEIVGNLVSKPYFEMTKKLLKKWGVEILPKSKNIFSVAPQKIAPQKNFEIEADASSAAHIFSLAVAAGGEITILNFPKNSLQGDAEFLEILKKFGAEIDFPKTGARVKMRGNPRSIGEINLEKIPDAAMNAVTLAALCRGKSRICGLKTLRVKECDRIFALEKNLQKMGVKVSSGDDFIEIDGNPEKLRGAKIECFDDHRIAMSFAILGTKVSGVEILDPKCVEKTFPNFWDIFEQCRR